MEDLTRILPKKRGTGRLDEPVAREPIAADWVVALPQAAGTGSGIASPLTEQEYAGETWYQLISSDGLFVFEFPDQTTYLDAAETEVVVVHRDPDA